MKRAFNVRIQCPFGEGGKECENILTLNISPYFAALGNDPPEGPCIEDARGCRHVNDSEYDDQVLWSALEAREGL